MDKVIVFRYSDKDGSFIGYHLSTFCNYTNDRDEAKRYSLENVEEQLEIIRKNLLTLDRGHNIPLVGILNKTVYDAYWRQYSLEDIQIYPEEYQPVAKQSENLVVVLKQ